MVLRGLQPDRGAAQGRASPSPPRCATSCARTRTSSWSARSATRRRRRTPSRRRSPATSCFSTLHTNDAASSISRLVDLGVEPFLDHLDAGRRDGAAPGAHASARTARPSATSTARRSRPCASPCPRASGSRCKEGEGCHECRGTGYLGRTGIFEVLAIDDAIKELVVKGADAPLIKREAIKHGMRTLRQSALRKLSEGVTTFEEVVRVTGLACVPTLARRARHPRAPATADYGARAPPLAARAPRPVPPRGGARLAPPLALQLSLGSPSGSAPPRRPAPTGTGAAAPAERWRASTAARSPAPPSRSASRASRAARPRRPPTTAGAGRSWAWRRAAGGSPSRPPVTSRPKESSSSPRSAPPPGCAPCCGRWARPLPSPASRTRRPPPTSRRRSRPADPPRPGRRGAYKVAFAERRAVERPRRSPAPRRSLA